MTITKLPGVILWLCTLVISAGFFGGNLSASTKKEKQTPIYCDSIAEVTEKKVCLLAQEIELQEQEKKEQAEIKKSDSPAMRKARKEIEGRQKRQEDYLADQKQAIDRAAIKGCAPGQVTVSPASQDIHRYNVMVSIRVMNTGAHSIDIEDPRLGVIVNNLCSKGTMSMHFSIHWGDSDTVTHVLRAVMRTSDGRIAHDTFHVNLNRFNFQYNRVMEVVWNITPHITPLVE